MNANMAQRVVLSAIIYPRCQVCGAVQVEAPLRFCACYAPSTPIRDCGVLAVIEHKE